MKIQNVMERKIKKKNKKEEYIKKQDLIKRKPR